MIRFNVIMIYMAIIRSWVLWSCTSLCQIYLHTGSCTSNYYLFMF